MSLAALRDFLWIDGLLNPVVWIVSIIVLGVAWDMRLLSNKTFCLMAWAGTVAYVIHMDLAWFSPHPHLGSLLVRTFVYALASAFITWGSWGYVKTLSGPEKIALSRGLAYRRERRAARRLAR